MFHANYDSFQLIFKFEDWSGIIGDREEHIQTIAEYINADNAREEKVLLVIDNKNGVLTM